MRRTATATANHVGVARSARTVPVPAPATALTLLRRKRRRTAEVVVDDDGSSRRSAALPPLPPRLFVLLPPTAQQIDGVSRGAAAANDEGTVEAGEGEPSAGTTTFDLDLGITELAGEAGAGKTQLCLGMCASAAVSTYYYADDGGGGGFPRAPDRAPTASFCCVFWSRKPIFRP